jgi:hypothetical protein
MFLAAADDTPEERLSFAPEFHVWGLREKLSGLDSSLGVPFGNTITIPSFSPLSAQPVLSRTFLLDPPAPWSINTSGQPFRGIAADLGTMMMAVLVRP